MYGNYSIALTLWSRLKACFIPLKSWMFMAPIDLYYRCCQCEYRTPFDISNWWERLQACIQRRCDAGPSNGTVDRQSTVRVYTELRGNRNVLPLARAPLRRDFWKWTCWYIEGGYLKCRRFTMKVLDLSTFSISIRQGAPPTTSLPRRKESSRWLRLLVWLQRAVWRLEC